MKPSFKERFAYWFDSRMSKGTSDLIRLLAIVSVLGIALITVLLVAFGYSEANGVDVFWDSFATIINAWMPYYSDGDGSIGYLVIMAIAAVIGLLITSVLIGIFTTAIEEYIDGCKMQAFSSTKIIVDKPQLEEFLSELHQYTPEEVKKYQRILNNRDKILAEARKKAQETEEKAQAYADHLVSETQITKMAQERAQEILNNAGEQAQQMLDSARDEAEAIRESALSYTYDKLVSIQSILNGTIDDTQNRFSSLLSSLNEHQRIVESNLQELNGTVPPEADITDHAGEYFDADRIPSFDDEEEDD